MNRSPGQETVVEPSNPSNPARKSAPKGNRPKGRMKEGTKQEALLTSPSDSGDQARLQARPPASEGHQPPSYYSVVSPAIPHFVAVRANEEALYNISNQSYFSHQSNEIRGGPLYPMPPPPPMAPVQLEHVSMGPLGPAFCDMQDKINQPYFDVKTHIFIPCLCDALKSTFFTFSASSGRG